MLAIGFLVVHQTPTGPAATGTPFAYHGQRGGAGGVHAFNQTLEFNRLRQPGLQGGHIHHPVQGGDTLPGGLKMQQATVITRHLHGLDRGGMRRIGPTAQGFEQGTGCGAECVGTHIAVAGCRFRLRIHQCNAQPFGCQLQGHGAPDDAGTAHTNIEWSGHRGIVGAGPPPHGALGAIP